MTEKFNHCRVNYIRDGLIEEFHEGVMEIRKLGDSTDFSGKQPYYIRSCAKPLQASLLIDYGMDFTQKELAFCSGSHAGEIYHIETALKIMQKLGIDESYLKCGIHPPLSRAMQDRMLLEGKEPSVIQNNCSGKHLGFLAICLKNGWDTETYFEPEHPLQIEVKKKIYELCKLNMPCNQFTTSDNNSDGYEDSVKEEDVSAFHTEADEEEIIGITTAAYRAKDDDENVNIKKIENYVDKAEGSNVSVPMHESINDEERNGTTRVHNDYTGDNADALTYPVTTDGCGVPIVSMPLGNLLIGYENLIKRYPRLINAIIENPYIYGGESRLDTEILHNSEGILAKVGASGLCVVYNIKVGSGFVVKMNDASNEARRIVVLEYLKRLGWADIEYDNKIRTLSGKVVGEITVTLDNM